MNKLLIQFHRHCRAALAMNDSMPEEAEVSGGLAQFATDNGYDALVMTQYDEQPVYIQSLQCLLKISGQSVRAERIIDVGHDTTTEVLAVIDLNELNSLDRLLETFRIWDTLGRRR